MRKKIAIIAVVLFAWLTVGVDTSQAAVGDRIRAFFANVKANSRLNRPFKKALSTPATQTNCTNCGCLNSIPSAATTSYAVVTDRGDQIPVETIYASDRGDHLASVVSYQPIVTYPSYSVSAPKVCVNGNCK